MNKFVIVLGLIAGLTVSAFAQSTEQAYIEMYKDRTDVPRPVKVVSPSIPADRTVDLSFTVTPTGAVRHVKVVHASDDRTTEAVVRAISEWKFLPAAGQSKDYSVSLKVVSIDS